MTKLTKDYWLGVALDWAEATAPTRLPGPQHDEMLEAIEELRADMKAASAQSQPSTTPPHLSTPPLIYCADHECVNVANREGAFCERHRYDEMFRWQDRNKEL